MEIEPVALSPVEGVRPDLAGASRVLCGATGASLQKLVQGIHAFQQGVFESYRETFERVVSTGQRPEALFVTCSDSRISPNLLTQTEPGELFILRNAGNIVPPHGVPGGEAATIEYAIEVLGIRDIIVCGHSHCGAMQALLHPSLIERLPNMRAWLCHAGDTARIIDESYAHLSDGARLTAAVEENVLVQLEHLRTFPTVAAALATHRVRLHGWVYKLETGQVFEYRPAEGQFVPLSEYVPAGTPERSI